MKKNRPTVVIANWKMNPQSLVEAKKILGEIKNTAKKYPSVLVMVAPPAIFLTELNKVAGGAIALGVQNIHFEPSGAFTGEISPTMVANSGAKFIIVGHSERRAKGESNEEVAKKVLAILKVRLTPVVCVGERERDEQGNFFSFIETQIELAFKNLPKTRFKDIIIAYEPIWAIGTGINATVEDVKEMQLFILKILTKHFGRAVASQVRIIYGGSVKADNAIKLYQSGGIDGFLVGGASLNPAEFSAIIASAAV